MEVRLLGPLEVAGNGSELKLGGKKPSSVLALLALAEGRPVSPDALAEALWGARPPATPANTLQVYVSGLRKALKPLAAHDETIVREGAGYRLALPPSAFDHLRFAELAKEGTSLLHEDAVRSRSVLSAARALWRGPARADIVYEVWAQSEAARLEELRLSCLDARIEADLACGLASGLVPELEALVAEHPLREKLQGQLMLALYRSGRQAEALNVYQRTRDRLLDELGLDPSPELQDLNRLILNQDATLAAPTRSSENLAASPPTPRTALGRKQEINDLPEERSRGLRSLIQSPRRAIRPSALSSRRGVGRYAAAVALVVAAILAVSVYLGTGSSSGSPSVVASPNSVAVIDPANDHVVAVIPVGTTPTTIVSGGGAVWTLNTGEQTISRIDASTRARTRTISAGAVASDIAYADRAIWVADASANTVSVLDESGGVETTIQLGIHHRRRNFVTPRIVLAAGRGHVWATGGDLTTVVVDAATRRVTRRNTGFPDVGADGTPAGPDIAIGNAGVWATDGRDELFHVGTSPTETVRLGGFGGDAGIEGIAVGTDVVWAAGAGVAWEVRARPARPTKTFTVGAGPTGIALGAGSLWTANAFDGTISRVRTGSGRTTTIHVGGTPSDLTFANGLVWVTIS